MDELISRPRSILSKNQSDLKNDIVTTSYDLFSTFSLPAFVMFYGLDLSLTNHNTLTSRLSALARCVTQVAEQFVVKDHRNDRLALYFSCLDLCQKQKEKNVKVFNNTLEDLYSQGQTSWEIEIRNVSFAYPKVSEDNPNDTAKEESPDYILKDFNFTFERGKTYSIVGHNGRGKTTLVQLLAGLYSPSKGQIIINGIDMANIDINDLRKKMSFLFQDFARYTELTVLENIIVGDVYSASPELAAQCAEATGVDFVPLDSTLYNLNKRPKNPDETWQSQISGGQWQKIALARAFMRTDSELLVLDEPTSALDIEAEHRLFKMILSRRRGKTTIFVTHRLNTTRIADCVLFIKDGKVIESGSHDELMAMDGEYARLFNIQACGYENLAEEVKGENA